MHLLADRDGFCFFMLQVFARALIVDRRVQVLGYKG
jgi:hypothetical protein